MHRPAFMNDEMKIKASSICGSEIVAWNEDSDGKVTIIVTVTVSNE